MPAGSRVRANNVYGTVSDNPLLIGAVSFTSLGLSLLPAITSPTQHAVVVFDPKRVFGEPEIVVVTSHTAMGTTATITRAQYGTVARAHPQGTAWAHVPVGPDDYIAIVTSGTRPGNPYDGQLIYETDTDAYVGRSGSAVWQTAVPLGAWTTFTPTWSGTLGAGILSGRYSRMGRTINYVISLQWGAGTSHAAATQTFALPFASFASGFFMPIGTVVMEDAGVSLYTYTATQLNSTTLMTATLVNTSISNTVPFTWGTGDKFMARGTYEAAS